MTQENQGQAKKNLTFVGKVKAIPTKNGDMYKINIDNPNPVDKDGNPNQYHKGVLIYIDNATGVTYQVKQLELKGVSAADAARGFTNSVALNLEDTQYSVTILE